MMLGRLGYILKLTTPKANVPDMVAYLNQTPIFEWYVGRCGPRIDTRETSI